MKGIQKQRVTIRFGERARMLLSELSERSGASVSSIVRLLVDRGLDGLMDKDGYWRDGHGRGESQP